MNTFMYYFNTAFLIKTSYVNNNNKKRIIMGLIVSRNRMRFLNRIKRSANFSLESLQYINKYQLIYLKNLYKKQIERK